MCFHILRLLVFIIRNASTPFFKKFKENIHFKKVLKGCMKKKILIKGVQDVDILNTKYLYLKVPML